MDIRCRKSDCIFNKAATCTAGEVNVFRCGACGTYRADKSKSALLKKNPALFELAEELTPSPRNNVPLSCKAGVCLFNKAGRCNANGIAVIDNEEHSRADCATFIER